MKNLIFLLISILANHFAFAELNLGNVVIGDNQQALKNKIHSKFECKVNESDKKKDTCRINYCNSIEDKKCMLWSEKELNFLRIYAATNSNKLEKMIIDLDYLNIKAQELLKIIEVLEKKLGKSDECPLRNFLTDSKAIKGIETCVWKNKEEIVLLYIDDARLKLKLEKNY
jgi:hypothetical protein